MEAWNAGIEQIEMRGAFAVGTEFVMTPPGQEPLLTRLIEVRENESFVDETRLRVTYAVEAIGPGCGDIGLAVSSDFPEVLKSLVRLAESRL